ncbi:hypothetical protein GCM10022267_35250 [Lentzea roselyniae]|uniref:Protein kinase domain-containing protein n=1 Tax=Lentzea roselyniae TaxID=531940 RepID=A0ABP7B217_9PSEU
MSDMPALIGRYVVERELGSGGMGEVYLAYSPAGDPVAVKLIRSDRLDPVTRARFEKEALIARTVVGTNRVARFLDADPYAGRPWLAMEYVPGSTCSSTSKRMARCPRRSSQALVRYWPKAWQQYMPQDSCTSSSQRCSASPACVRAFWLASATRRARLATSA